MNRTVIGIQTHHSVQLDDAVRGVANASAGLRGAYKLTDFPRLLHLLDQLGALARELAAERNAARARLAALHATDPERFQRCRDGMEPWPDEVPEGFTPRCTCHELCLHRLGVDPGPNGVCNCARVRPPCPRHEQD